MPKGQAGKGAAEIEKKTEKEKLVQKKLETERIVAEIRALLRQEQGTFADSPEWKEFENMLAGFLNGDIKGNAADISIRMYENIQNFSKGRKNFIEFAKGQQTARKLLEEMQKVPGANEYEPIQPLFHFLAHAAGNGVRKKAVQEDIGVLTEYGRKIGYMTLLSEEGAKKDMDEAEELLKEFHRKMGLADPEKIKKAQKSDTKDETELEELREFEKKLKTAEKEGEELKKARLEGKEIKNTGKLEKMVEEAQPILGPKW